MIRKFVLLFTCLLVSSFSVTAAQAEKKVFVLVHGAFQDAAGWSQVITALETDGNTAIPVQLAGRADDTTPLNEITLESYRDAVVAVINEQSQPVVLVGHSFGGMVISAVAEAVPEKIASLVYLAAYLPANGESLVTISSQDKYSVLGQEGNFIIAADYSVASVNEAVFASAFCPDCTPEQLTVVADSQLDEPLAPLNQPVALTDENFGAVHKAYILTAQDVIVSPQLQALMLAKTPVDQVFALNAGHVPFITLPEALAALLTQVEA